MTKSYRYTIRNKDIVLPVLLVLFFIFCWFNLDVPFMYDDVAQIPENIQLHDLFNFKDILSEPIRTNRVLQNISFALDWKIGGGETWSFHLTNNLLHLANAGLFFVLLRLLGISFAVRFVSILIFFVHPLEIEAMTYIMGRTELLKTLLTLSALILYIKNPRSIKVYILLVLSLLVKESCLLNPFLLLAYDLLVRKKFLRTWFLDLTSVLWIIPIFLIFPSNIHQEVVGFDLYPMTQYVWTSLYHFSFYLYQFISTDQSIYHGWVENPPVTFVLLGLCLYLALGYAIIRFRHRRSVLSFLIFFFLFSLLPNLSILQFINPYAEHRNYQSHLFLSFFAAMILIKLPYRKILIPVTVICLTIIHLTTIDLWKNEKILWAQAWEKYPQDFIPTINTAHNLILDHQCMKASELIKSVCPPKRARHKYIYTCERISLRVALDCRE